VNAHVELRDVNKTYHSTRGDVRALADIDIDIREGEFLSLLGPSGCGKSTLLRLVAGLTPATRGTIAIRDAPVREPFADVGFVFQQPVLLPWRSVLDNVLFSVEMLGLEPRQYRKQALDLLELTGLAGFETKYPHELSGGMRQRVGIARALAVEPPVLLMDEPFSALDVLTAENLRNELIKLWEGRRFRPVVCESGDGSAFSGSNFVRELERIGATRLVAHGTHDADGLVTGFFTFACTSGADAQREAYLAQLVVPFLHAAWVRTQLLTDRTKRNAEPTKTNTITPREQEILRWIYLGKSNFEIGAILNISPLTVKNHVQKILRKLNVVNRAQAVGKALELRILNI